MKKSSLLYLLFGLTLFPLYKFCERETEGFSVSRITLQLPAQTSSSKSCDLTVFDQPFHFLGSGGQCFAFASEDGKYVLKLLSPGRTPQLATHLPLPSFIQRAVQKRIAYAEKKWQRDLSSYKLAFDELKEESGLIYLHVTETDTLSKKVKIFDKLNISHEIDLDSSAFILQKKAEPLLSYLKKRIQNNEQTAAKVALEQAVNLLISRCKKGVFDEDPRLHKNLGFSNEGPLFIDVGRFKRDESRKDPAVYSQDLVQMTTKLKVWLAQEDPSLASHLEELVR